MKELQKMLIDSFETKIAGYGYQRLPKGGQSFCKQFSGGKLSFHLAFIDHPSDFDVTIDIAIRFDELENLVNANNKLLTKKEKEAIFSLGVEMGNLVEGAQKRWHVSAETDVPIIVEELFYYFETYAIPYFDKYSDMKNTFELLSSHEKSIWIHSPIHGARAKRVIGLAKLLGYGNEKLSELIEENKTFLQQSKDFGLNDFVNFAQHLQS